MIRVKIFHFKTNRAGRYNPATFKTIKIKNMSYSTCCNAKTNETEIGLCPECLEHCDFVDYEEQEKEDNNWLWQAMARRDKAIKEGTMNEQ